MIIPARRFMWLAAVPLVVVLNGRGTPGAIVAAWISHGFDHRRVRGAMGCWPAGGRGLRLDREAPAQLYVEQPNRDCLGRREPERVSA